jgi:hypothetical protein
MKYEHQRFKHSLETLLTPIGFVQELDDEFSIQFVNDAGWKVSVDSDRHYKGVFRWIVAPDGFRYSVFLLLRVFEQETKSKIKLRNANDWIEFIHQNRSWIFRSPQPYKTNYENMDQASI